MNMKGRKKNNGTLSSYIENVRMFFLSPSSFLKTGNDENFKSRMFGSFAVFLFFIAAIYIRYEGFTYNLRSTIQYDALLVSLLMITAFLLLLFLYLKIFGFKPRIKDIIVFFFTISFIGLLARYNRPLFGCRLGRYTFSFGIFQFDA